MQPAKHQANVALHVVPAHYPGRGQQTDPRLEPKAENRGTITHYLLWEEQRWDEKAGELRWMDADLVPCFGDDDMRDQKLDAALRGERNIRVIPKGAAS